MNLSTPAERRTRIRLKLEGAGLPSAPPAPEGRAPLGATPWARTGTSAGGVCSGCDEAIKPGDVMRDYSYPSGAVIRFHEECERVWDELRRSVWRSHRGWVIELQPLEVGGEWHCRVTLHGGEPETTAPVELGSAGPAWTGDEVLARGLAMATAWAEEHAR